MKVIIIGNVLFTLEMLNEIFRQDVEIVGVITKDDDGINSDYVNLVPWCQQHRISYFKTEDINSSETIEWIKSKSADVIFCLGWSKIIKQQVLKVTPLGVIGYHPAALPQNRGRHPLIWAIVLGLHETASTFFFMDEGVDSGDILSQEIIKISIEDDAKTLYEKMVQTAKVQVKSMMISFEKNNFLRIPQNHSVANVWRKRSAKDGEIDWRMSASSIHNLIRGLTHPYVGAHFICKEAEYKVWKSEVVEYSEVGNIEPGKVINIGGNTMIVKCNEKCIKLLEIKPMPKLLVGEYL